MRAKSGSYVKTRGFGLNVGFARELSNKQGRLLFGPVVEYGGGTMTAIWTTEHGAMARRTTSESVSWHVR